MNDFITINMVETKKVTSLKLDQDRFKIKYPWLQKLLVKLGWITEVYDEAVHVERIRFKEKDFVNSLLERYYYTLGLNTKINKIYMGPEEFDELVGSRTAHEQNMLTFDVKVGYNRQLFNIPVVVVPYMQGVLFV